MSERAGKQVNKRELAEILGVSERTLTEWQKQGLPGVSTSVRGGGNRYDTAEVIEWMVGRVSRTTGEENQRDRLARLQGDAIEIDLAERRHSLLDSSEIEPAWAGMVVAFRQAMLSLPGRVVPMLAQCDHEDSMREVLRAEVEAALQKLASGDDSFPEGDDAAGAGESGATAADQTVGVGGALS